jgi:hypothetical protein
MASMALCTIYHYELKYEGNLMATLPTDIDKKIDQLFRNKTHRKKAKRLILSLWQTSLNVGPAQLARSILTISEGELSKIQEIFSLNFYDDPRDVINHLHTLQNGRFNSMLRNAWQQNLFYHCIENKNFYKYF